MSPFYRTTQNQIQQFYLNQQTSFVSGLNVGNQTSRGVEFELDKGNFNANGLSARLSFTYTNSFINYTIARQRVERHHPHQQRASRATTRTPNTARRIPRIPKCGSSLSGVAAAPCYTTAGAPDAACAAGDVANPYWNAPVQDLFGRNGELPTFDLLPAGIGSAVNGYGAPYTASLVLERAGQPTGGCPDRSVLRRPALRRAADDLRRRLPTRARDLGNGHDRHDPRYKYGAPGGSSVRFGCCGTIAGDPRSRTPDAFDGIGAFVAPSQLQLHLQVGYDVSKSSRSWRTSPTSSTPASAAPSRDWVKGSVNGKSVCSYSVVGAGTRRATLAIVYNPGEQDPTVREHPVRAVLRDATPRVLRERQAQDLGLGFDRRRAPLRRGLFLFAVWLRLRSLVSRGRGVSGCKRACIRLSLRGMRRGRMARHDPVGVAVAQGPRARRA